MCRFTEQADAHCTNNIHLYPNERLLEYKSMEIKHMSSKLLDAFA